MKILVIGGSGFIGSNFVELGIQYGHKIAVIDNEKTGSPQNLKSVWTKIKYHKADKFANDILNPYLRNADLVVDFAGYCSAPMFKPDPRAGMHETVCGFLNLLELMRINNTPKLIFASSTVIYGNGPVPSKESDPIVSAKFFYAESKLMMERYGQIYNNVIGKPEVVALRFFSNYGPNENQKRAWNSDLRNVLTQCIEWVATDTQPWFYCKGKQTRDYIFVKDTAEAVFLAGALGKGGEIYNVCTGKETSYNRGLGIINNLFGKDIKPRYVEPAPRDYIMRSLGDPTKAKRELGFEAKYSLEMGLMEEIEYMRKEGIIGKSKGRKS